MIRPSYLSGERVGAIIGATEKNPLCEAGWGGCFNYDAVKRIFDAFLVVKTCTACAQSIPALDLKV